MKINKVHIHNYRSIQDAVISFQDYSIIVGENNVGKSNIVDAIRCFYGDIRFEESDFCKQANAGDTAWIEVEYDLTPVEYASLDEKYQIEENKLRINKNLTRGSGFRGYTKKGIERGTFYGSRKFKPEMLGKLIYVPAVVGVKESTKTSGASAMNSLLDLVAKQGGLEKRFDELFEPVFNHMKSCTRPIGDNISRAIASTGVGVDVAPRFVSFGEMLKFMMEISIRDRAGTMDLNQIGTGTQRKIIAELIKYVGDFTLTTTEKGRKFEDIYKEIKKLEEEHALGKKIFSPELNVLLFEEPEVSLHPSAISDLATDLRNFASSPNNQVIATTHSSQLVSEDIMDLNSVIKVDRIGTKTQVFQNKIPDSDLSAAKNLVYFDRPRSDMFFARKVVLMEGPTEYALYNYLRRTGALPQNIAQNITVIDCVGKWPMPYFQRVLNNYNIRHAVLYDTDGDPNRADNIAVRQEFSPLTDYSYGFPKDIETFCGIKKQGNPAINIVRAFESGQVAPDKRAAIVQVFQDLLTKTK